jgi:hypothetical protein
LTDEPFDCTGAGAGKPRASMPASIPEQFRLLKPGQVWEVAARMVA